MGVLAVRSDGRARLADFGPPQRPHCAALQLPDGRRQREAIADHHPDSLEDFRAALQINPAVRGQVDWQGDTLIFRPADGSFAEATTYAVTLGTGAAAADGAPLLGRPYRWTFRTGVFQPAAHFGWGANAQVLDADGRRAVQFGLYEQHALVSFELYALTLPQFLDRYASGFRGVAGREDAPISTADAPLVKRWRQDPAGAEAQETLVPPEVPPGLYVLDLSAGRVNDQLILVLTRNTLTVKQSGGQLVAWVTNINGEPVPGAEVSVHARDGSLLASGAADELGIYRAEVARDPLPLIVVARQGDDLTASGLSPEWRTPGGNWRFWWQPTVFPPDYSTYIYTDRPIYRPGQTVYFKAIVRRDDDALLSIPPAGTPVTVRLRDARNNVVQTLPLTTNHFGSVNGQFQLAEGGMLGEYAVEVAPGSESHRQTFKVEDYRKPDYQVTVSTDARAYVDGDTIRVTVDSRYYFGEPVAEAQVTIRRYQLGPRYEYGGDGAASPADYVWLSGYGGADIRGKTDADGRFTFTLTAEADYGYRWDWRSDLRQITWGIEATLDDGSHQTVSGFAAVDVFSAAQKLYMDTGGYAKTPGQSFTVTTRAVTLEGRPAARRSLRLELRGWNSYDNEYTRVVQSAQATTGADGTAHLPFTVRQAGFYQLRLSGADGRGRPVSSSTYLYVFDEAALWQGSNHGDLSLGAERDSYAPGETARLLIESTFSGPALLTFERGSTRREQLVQLAAPLTVVDVPIQPDDAPNIFVAVNAWKEQDTALRPDTYSSLPDSRLRTATLELRVPVTDKTLTVTITPDKPVYAPREPATFTVRVTNARGEGVSAEVSLAIVDEAIFALSADPASPIFDAFYHPRENLVRTFDSLALSRYLGGGKGGGGGGGGMMPASPRSDFPDTAEWFPVLVTDWKGEATVTVALPDSLTSWRLTARAATADTQVG
ncbi:MAG: hypothetical protein HY784_01510 [Chloroflexi bacterium]|nr:hypothetical protein [Chloroflexota bacterium]